MEQFQAALSFDDVLLVPQKSEVLPNDTNISSQLGSNIKLNIPIVSAAMDTVSEANLAIALARQGGLGVIHRNMTIEQQANMVQKVKRSENAVIEKPFTVSADISVHQLMDIMQERGVAGFPVVDDKDYLLGIVTSRDIRYLDNKSLQVKSVMTPIEKLVTASKGSTVEEARELLYKHRIEKLPLIDNQGRLAGLITGADIEKTRTFLDAAKDPYGHLLCGSAVGVGEDYLDRAQALAESGADALFIDAATGHTKRVMDVVTRLAQDFNIPIVAGNVVTAEGARDLKESGASVVKVGVGPGSICTTRIISGAGMPQLTAILNVVEYAKSNDLGVIADGGIRYSGDAVKALAAGADLVMLGSMLAGTAESPGEIIYNQGRRYKSYRGMGSLGAMEKGSKDRYGQNSSGKLVAEGVEGRVAYKGPLENVIFQMTGGIRSGMGYTGAGTLPQLREKAQFVRLTPGGLKESHVHDIVMTSEPGNYQALS